MVAAVLTLIVVVVLVVSRPRAPVDHGRRTADQSPGLEPTPAPRGDPVLAGRLAEQALQVAGEDRPNQVRLLLAAHVLAPDSVAFRINLAQVLLTDVGPAMVIRTGLDTGGSIKYATLSSDASFLLTSSASGAQLWQTRWISNPPIVRLAQRLDAPVSAAAGAGRLTRTNLLLISPGGVDAWRAVTPVHTDLLGHVADRADAVAVSPDADTAVTVQQTRATLWDLAGPHLQAQVTLEYRQPVTTLAFSPGDRLVLAAGHTDGAVTVHTINLDQRRTTERTLSGPASPVQGVAVSADASTVLALHQNGTLSAWNLHATTAEPAGTVTGAFGAGPARVWVSATGDYAVVSDATGPPSLWSLAHPAAPIRVHSLRVGTDPAVPAMISADGRTILTIDHTQTLTIWDLGSIVDTLADAIGQACQTAEMTEQQWRQMVPDPAVANPCGVPSVPTLGVDHT